MTDTMQAGGLAMIWLGRSLATAFGKVMPPDQKMELISALQAERAKCLSAQASMTAPEQETQRNLLTVVQRELGLIIASISEEPEKPAEG